MQKEKITLTQLESFLFKSADILRGKMDASRIFNASYSYLDGAATF